MRRAVRFHFFQRDSRWIGLIGHMEGIYVGINFFFHWRSGDRRCVNESFAHDLPGGKRVRWSSWGRRPTDLARVRIWQPPRSNVNTSFCKPCQASPNFFVRYCLAWPFVAVVIETLEHKAISESSEVMTKLTANSCIDLCGSTNAVSISSARTM